VRALRDAGLRTGALVTPDLEAVRAAHAADLEFVDLATSALLGLAEPSRPAALERLADAARLAAKLRLEVGVAGGLSPRELPLVLEVAPVAARVTVGRAFVSRALLLGADRAVRDLRERIE
jgi:pyridoxine 5'-phosphate synthase PdxJ